MDIENKTTDVGVSRRTVLRTAAWSAPVITVMSAAPAFAVSGEVEGPTGSHKFDAFSSTITVSVGGKGLITFYWTFKNTGSQPLNNVTFTFTSKGIKRWIPAAGLILMGRATGRGSAKAKATPDATFLHSGVVAPGQQIAFSVSAVPTKKNRNRPRIVQTARRNSTAIASAELAGTKPILFNITSIGGRRPHRGGHFSS